MVYLHPSLLLLLHSIYFSSLLFIYGPILTFPSFQPKAVSETEEQDLAQLMAKAGQENAEVSGDEDEADLL
jgi:hypothetical protein